jgi:hypothetical protein
MPEHTLRAFAGPGVVARTLDANPEAAERMLAAAAEAGLDLAAITAVLSLSAPPACRRCLSGR